MLDSDEWYGGEGPDKQNEPVLYQTFGEGGGSLILEY